MALTQINRYGADSALTMTPWRTTWVGYTTPTTTESYVKTLTASQPSLGQSGGMDKQTHIISSMSCIASLAACLSGGITCPSTRLDSTELKLAAVNEDWQRYHNIF